MSTAKKFAGQTAVYGLSTIASRMLSFFLTPIYTEAYKQGGSYGILTIMFSYVSILNAVMAFGMETTYFRYLNKHADKKQEVYNNSFSAIFGVSILFLLLTLPFTHHIAVWIQAGKIPASEFERYIKYFVAILVIDAWCVMPFAKLRADGRPGRYGLIKFVNVIIFIALNLTFIWGLPFWVAHHLPGTSLITPWFVKGWVGYVFLSNLIASVITLLLLLPELFKLTASLDKKMLWHMFAYSWPVLIANLSFLVNENLDKLLLSQMLPDSISVQQVAIYGGCAKIALFLSIFVQAFRLGAEPFFFNHAKNKNAGTTYARIMDYFVIVVAIIFVALVANIQLLKYFVRDEKLWVGLTAVPPLVFGYVSLGIYMNLSVWYKLSDQTKYGLYISGIGAIITILLNVIFIPKYSYMASAWVSFTAYTVMMILSYIWGQKNYPIPYNLKKNLSYIIISILLVYLSFYVFKRNIFVGNALLLLFAGGALLMEGKELKAIFIKK
ncbi:polysaccharide biosynthesis C-terminal domain-containing protein [Mucilaginibacter mali]|uniref:Polysaccharide biosynthesis C-terminal domain-containing protein n=1 Tax=Mucilaginibacter mali TaxID=2740462 RepID=A0A7D4QH32_9SPHI|nr:polysaccharide biosynthesis C-terminal domain-containing protein [Mucilaginibacter mali]QKJ31632.1 polysaccharide biosynthesis C-terminal domain-containing protein [Mucilaginibacter mali]